MTKNKKHNANYEKPEKKDISEEENVETTNVEMTEEKTEPVTEQEQKTEEKTPEIEVKKEEKPNKEQEYLLMAQKIQAEFENYKKRTIKAEKEANLNGIAQAVTKFLPVIDSFNFAQKQEQNEEYLKANAVIINQLNKALSDLGVEKIEALGKQFDYNLHNAIMVDNNEDHENNEIVEVFQEGYKIQDKIIRHSIVKVNQK